MKYTLKVITPPGRWPVERADVMNMVHLDPDNPNNARDQMLLEDLIAAATSKCEQLTGRAFITQTLELTLTPVIIPKVTSGITTYAYEQLPETIKIWRPPCQTITGITATAQDLSVHTISPTIYNADIDQEPAMIRLNFNAWWPFYIRGWYKIQYVAGYGDKLSDVPGPIRHAIRITVAQWWASRENFDYTVPTQAVDLLDNYAIEANDLI